MTRRITLESLADLRDGDKWVLPNGEVRERLEVWPGITGIYFTLRGECTSEYALFAIGLRTVERDVEPMVEELEAKIASNGDVLFFTKYDLVRDWKPGTRVKVRVEEIV